MEVEDVLVVVEVVVEKKSSDCSCLSVLDLVPPSSSLHSVLSTDLTVSRLTSSRPGTLNC